MAPAQHALNADINAAAAFNQEKSLYVDTNQPLGKLLPQLHSVAEGEASGLRDASGPLMPPCIIMEKGEALDVWIENSGEKIDLFSGLQVPVAGLSGSVVSHLAQSSVLSNIQH